MPTAKRPATRATAAPVDAASAAARIDAKIASLADGRGETLVRAAVARNRSS